jgi:hypothetical protein
MRWTTTPEVRRDEGKGAIFGLAKPSASQFLAANGGACDQIPLQRALPETEYRDQPTGNRENVSLKTTSVAGVQR